MPEPGPGPGPPPDEATVALPTWMNPVVPGSTKEPCVRCDDEVWISPGTRQSIEDGVYPDTILCIVCATELAEEEDADDDA